jgi:hypothetical protein
MRGGKWARNDREGREGIKGEEGAHDIKLVQPNSAKVRQVVPTPIRLDDKGVSVS